jgi:acetyl esterase/lipase
MDNEKIEAIERFNKKTLSNGMTRRAFLDSLCRKYSQDSVSYPEFEGKGFLDLPYDDKSERQKLNIYLPEGGGLFPVIIWVHGGGWFMGDRSDFALSTGLKFIQYGYAIVSLGYRLAQEAIHPRPVEDVLNALAFLRKRADMYSLDMDRCGVMSGSAGTVIAALAALQDKTIRAAVLRCPIFDFASIRKQFEKIGLQRSRFNYPDEDTSIEALYLGGDINEMPEACADSNPANHLAGHIPYFLIEHGLLDTDTPYLQSLEFAENVCKVSPEKDRAICVVLENTGHDNGGFDLPSTFEREVNFFNQHLGSRGEVRHEI